MKQFFLSLVSFVFIGLTVDAQTPTPDSLYTGLQLTPKDELEKIEEAPMVFGGGELPNSVDMSSEMPPVGDQGMQSSCVAWTVGYAVKSFYEHKEEKTSYTSNGSVNLSAVFSPAFIYNQIQIPTDRGAHFKVALDLLFEQGAAKWSAMPYSQNSFSAQPSEQVRTGAKKYKIDKWDRVSTTRIEDIRSLLAGGTPVMIGANVDRDFQQKGYWAAQNGTEFIWTQKASFNGSGHAMTVVGYDDTKAAFKVMNSWGRNWGQQGYCWISYGLFPMVVVEAYIMKDHSNDGADVPHVVVDTNPVPDTEGNTDFNIPFVITNATFVAPNWQIPVPSLAINGLFQVPARSGKTYEVVVRFYHNSTPFSPTPVKGTPVMSMNPWFRMPDGSLAVSTGKNPIQNNFAFGMDVPWWCAISVDQFMTPAEKTSPMIEHHYYVAEAVLYVDNYPVKTSPLIPFYVDF